MPEPMDLLKIQIKTNIKELVNREEYEKARQLLNQYTQITSDDLESFSIQSVIYIHQGNFLEARNIIEKGLDVDNNNFELLFNLAYVFEQLEDFPRAYKFYKKAKESCTDVSVEEQINKKLNNLEGRIKKRDKLIFFIKHDINSFVDDIVEELSDKYETRFVKVSNLKQIDEGMQWADLCWFEWCDELIAYGSKLAIAKDKFIICRLHSYEAFAGYTNQVQWDSVDKVIFVAEHVREFVLENTPILPKEKTVVIPNGIDVSKYHFKERGKGFRIAYVGYINYKKGPMLLLHTFKAIHDSDSRYKLYMAGTFQDGRDVLYFKQMIREWKLENSVIYQGWQNNIDQWLEDKDYILCTSLLESQNLSVMQAMTKGIKPLIHNFVGAREIYPDNYIWSSIEECVKLIRNKEYDSKAYANYIKDKYLFNTQMCGIEELLGKLNKELAQGPLVSVGITIYNGKPYMEQCIESFLHQTYPNIEILLIDDCSTDGSKEIIEKYQRKHKNIRVIYHKSNSGGVSKGFQELITQARGKYLQWLACDDFVEPTAVEQFVAYLEDNPEKDYVYCDFNIVDENNVQKDVWKYNLLNVEQIVSHIFHTGSGIMPMNCMYRKEFFNRNKVNWIKYRDNDFSSDTLNCLHFIKNNLSYGKIMNPVINYRVHSCNASHNLEKRIKTSISLFDYIIRNFNEKVYLSEVNWNDITHKEQYKNLVLARFYYSLLENHLNGKMIPEYLKVNITQKEILAYCQVYVQEGIRYINKGMQNSIYYQEFVTFQKLYKDVDIYHFSRDIG